jgi:dolichol kinase
LTKPVVRSAAVNVARKIWHSLGIIVPVVYWSGWLARETILWIVGVALIVLGVVEVLRFTLPPVQRAFAFVFGLLLRDEEMKGPHGSLYFLSGVFVCVLLFPKHLACVGLVYLAVGDTAAEVVGRRFGRVKLLGPKTLEGSAACFVSSAAVGLFLLPWPLALVGAAAATLFELFGTGNVDNATIPVGAAAAMYGMTYLL